MKNLATRTKTQRMRARREERSARWRRATERGGTSRRSDDQADRGCCCAARRPGRGARHRRLRQRRQTATSSSASGGSGTIAFLLPETQTARYETQDKPLFERRSQELCPDCDILYQNADQDPTKQQSQVEAAVTEGVDVIVLDPVDSTSAAGMVTRAQQADIPVISYDRLILDADLAAYAEFNSPEVGKQQGEALAKALADGRQPEGPDRPDQRRSEGQQREVVQGGRDGGVRRQGHRRRPGVRHARLAAGERPEGDGPGDHGARQGRVPRRPRRQRRHRRRRDRGAQGRRHRPDDDPGHRPGRRAGGDPADHRR